MKCGLGYDPSVGNYYYCWYPQQTTTVQPYASIGGYLAPAGLLVVVGGLVYFSIYAVKLKRLETKTTNF